MCQRQCIKAWDSQFCFEDDIHELVNRCDLLQTLGIQHAGLDSTSDFCTLTNLIYVQIVPIDLISHIMCQNVSRASRKFWYHKVVAVEGDQGHAHRIYSIKTIYTYTRLLHVQEFDVELSPACWIPRVCNRSCFLTSSWISSSKFNFKQNWLSQALIHCRWHILYRTDYL
jgi:hypothetical protein